jgi:sensor histidine kinase YesM
MGTGLKNTRERLRHHFPDDFELTLDNEDEGGASVLLEIPCRRPKGQEPVP